jgi:hypothetical protein
LSTHQFPQADLALILRSTGDPIAITPDVRAAIRDTDPAITSDRATSLGAILDDQLATRRITTEVTGGSLR